MTTLRTWLVVWHFGLLACDADKSLPQQPAVPPAGVVRWAIGPERGEVPFSEVTCTKTDDITQVALRYPAVLQTREFRARPYTLVAQIPASAVTNASTPGMGASVYLPNLSIDGRDYPMLQLIGRAMPGVPVNVTCTLERSELMKLTCQHMRVMPWLSPTPVPEAAIEAKFRCDS